MGAKILIIDDSDELRDLLREVLRARKYSVITAETGHKGIELFKSEAPDLIICDIAMPVMDGIEVIEQIQALDTKRHTPVIFLTATMIRLEQMAALKAQGYEYLMKPYRTHEMLAVIERLLAESNEAE